MDNPTEEPGPAPGHCQPLPRAAGQLPGPARLCWGQPSPKPDPVAAGTAHFRNPPGRRCLQQLTSQKQKVGCGGQGRGREGAAPQGGQFRRRERTEACGGLPPRAHQPHRALATGPDGTRVLFPTAIKQISALSFLASARPAEPSGCRLGGAGPSLTYLTGTALAAGGIAPRRSRELPPFQASARQLCMSTRPRPPSPNSGCTSWAPGWYQGPTASSWREKQN